MSKPHVEAAWPKLLKCTVGYNNNPPAKWVTLRKEQVPGARGSDVEMEGANDTGAESTKQKVD